MTSFTATYTMKATDLPWLVAIPEHWQLCRAKEIFYPVDIRSVDGLEEILTVSSTLGIVPRKFANVTMFEAVSYSGYKLCWPGDLVINSLWAWAFALGVSQYHGVVSTAYGVYRLLPGVQVDLRFIHLLLRSVPFQWELQTRSKGIWISRLQLTDESFLDAPLPLPTLEEQMSIAKYLDHADQMLRGGVSQKLELVELMEEYKRAVIQQAVTRGLDPDVHLKPSGVEWLGDIPEHWEVRRLKTVADMRVSNIDKHINDDEIPVRLCNYVDVYKNDLIDGTIDFMSASATEDEISRFHLRIGDVLITKDSETWDDIGVPALVVETAPDLVSGYHLALLRPDTTQLLGSYLFRALQSRAVAYQFHVEARGVTRYGLSHSGILSAAIPLPPVEEQAAIVAHLDKLTSDIDAAIAHTRREIELLEEYRTRLIADVVTGKLDVREAAANLPDVNPDDLQSLAEDGEADD